MILKSLACSLERWPITQPVHQAQTKPAQIQHRISLAAAMPGGKATVVEEEMVGKELHVMKPMKFKVSVAYLHLVAIFLRIMCLSLISCQCC